MGDQPKIHRRVWFRNWAGILEREPFPYPKRERYRRWIIRYLAFCKETRTIVCEASAQTFQNKPEFVNTPEARGSGLVLPARPRTARND